MVTSCRHAKGLFFEGPLISRVRFCMSTGPVPWYDIYICIIKLLIIVVIIIVIVFVIMIMIIA